MSTTLTTRIESPTNVAAEAALMEQLAVERFAYERGLGLAEWLVVDPIVRERYRSLVRASRSIG